MKRPDYSINDAFDYLDGRLEPDEAAAFEASAAEHSRVSGLLDEAKAARSLFQVAGAQAQPSQADWRRIDREMLKRIGAEADEPAAGMGWLAWLTPVARGLALAGVAAVLALGAVAVWRALDAPNNAAPGSVPVAQVEVQVQDAPQMPPVPEAVVGQVLAAGKSGARVTLADAQLSLRPASAAKVVRKDAEATVVDLINGEITCEVGKRAPGAVYQVRARDVVVTVLGTRFTVNLDRATGGVAVGVEEGVVRVQRGDEPAAVLRAGDSVELAARVDVAEAPKKEVVEPQPVELELVKPEPETVVPEPAAFEKPKAKKRRPKARKKPAKTIAIEVTDPQVTVEVVDHLDPGLKAVIGRIGKVAREQSLEELGHWLQANQSHPDRRRAVHERSKLRGGEFE